MLFNSVTFLLLFLPVSLAVYFLLGKWGMAASKTWLALLSFLFYAWWDPRYLLLLVGSVLFNYLCGYLIQVLQDSPRAKTGVLFLGVSADLGILFYYKYLFTLAAWLQGLGWAHPSGWGSLVLPLGISFFTFTQIGFLLDVHGGHANERGFLEYVLFVTFFPHLIAGPILHHKEIMPQFAERGTYVPSSRNLGVGLSFFILGLSKKVLIADPLSPLANAAFKGAADLTAWEAWAGVVAYSFQLYFDFSGYSEMALGLARMFNVVFPANFDSPFRSLNLIEFWQRWHISLTRYLTLYLYNPLSLWVVRKRQALGLPLMQGGKTTFGGYLSMVVLPTFFTMVLIGIWHGAGWQFLIFGALHGTYLSVNNGWKLFGPKPVSQPSFVRRAWTGIWKWTLTYFCVLVAFIFFRTPSAREAWTLLCALFGGGTGENPGGMEGPVESVLAFFGRPVPPWNDCGCWISLALLLGIILLLPNLLQVFQDEGVTSTKVRSAPAFFGLRWKPSFAWALFLALLALADLLLVAGNTEFLYFRF